MGNLYGRVLNVTHDNAEAVKEKQGLACVAGIAETRQE
jgi:hypothetical protein